MSALSDNQRRLICRCLFLLVCLVPTLATVYQMAHPQTPEQWSVALRAELGLETEIGAVETPGPNETILRDLRFYEGDQTLFQTVEARIVYGEINKVIVDYPVSGLNSIGLSILAKRINQRFLTHRSKLTKIWRIEFRNELKITRAESKPENNNLAQIGSEFSQELERLRNDQMTLAKNARIDITPTSEGTSVIAYFRVQTLSGSGDSDASNEPQSQFGETMLFKISSHQNVQEFELETKRGKLPVWLLDGVRPELSHSLGRNATFEGLFKLRPDRMKLSYLAGVFDQVDLSQYTGFNNSTELGWVEIKKCRFDDGKFQAWQATLTSPSLRTTQIHEQYLFKHAKQFAFYSALSETVREAQR